MGNDILGPTKIHVVLNLIEYGANHDDPVGNERRRRGR